MDKAILKKFAIESRRELMEKIKTKVDMLYLEEDFNKKQKGDIFILINERHTLTLKDDEFYKRELLIKRIKELSFNQVIEEAAYTWFNRIIAIRYMEIHDYLPLTKDNQSLGIRVLSSKDNTPDPEILKFTNLTNPDLDIDFKEEKYRKLENDNEKFKYVLLLVCKKLGRVIPHVFDGVTDYIDILIPDNLLNDTGFVTKVINEVPESNYNQVEIIGWLYQYYNQTEKDRVISAKKAYKKNEIPYATQLFTPDWIVKYMVENSLGRYWVEHDGSVDLIKNWKYFINDNINFEEKPLTVKEVNNMTVKEFNNTLVKKLMKIDPKDIKCIDPCCGSGHILVYMFEVLFQIYESYGYSKKDIAELILENNLYGLDIDDRAGQLSILSVLLKAREYDKNIFNKKIVRNLNIMSIQESNTISESAIDSINEENIKEKARYLIDNFKNAKEIGSLLILENNDYSKLKKDICDDTTIFGIELKEKLLPIIKIAEVLSRKYDVVVTNPPYMNYSVMSINIKTYLSKYYQDAKTDLCAAFMEVYFLKKNGLLAMINQHSWMFLSSFEKLRYNIINNKTILTMIHLGTRAFEKIGGEVVQTTTFVIKNAISNNTTTFIRLVDYENSDLKEQKYLENIKSSKDIYYKNLKDFNSIPGTPIAYWISQNFSNIFEKGISLGKIAHVKQGLATSDNNRFLRKWYEVDINKALLNSSSVEEAKNSVAKWFPYNKGGEYRKWYGNNDYVVNWENDGFEIKNFKDSNGKIRSVVRNPKYYFKKAITWSLISSSNIAFRSKPFGHIFDVAGMSYFPKDEDYCYLLGFSNTKIVKHIMEFIAPTLNFQVGDVAKIPILFDDKQKERINSIVEESICLSKKDWDSFETSWNFKKHPLIIEYNKERPYIMKEIKDEETGVFLTKVSGMLELSYAKWKKQCDENFEELKKNEEELNKIFIDIYGLQDELTPEEEDKDVTIRKADQEREIKSLISYAVGCMFGRYSLEKDGLIYAGGDFDKVYKKYKGENGGWAGVSLANYTVLNDNGKEIDLSFEVDNDNVIPITDEAYFEDDIVERFKKFISVVYGKETLNENIDFIAETLGKKGTETSEDTIRRYFVNDFFNDHVKTYQKRPIYWLFDSGKKNGFKALIYMHRYNENLVPKIRLNYVHRMQNIYEKLLSDINYKLTTKLSMNDKKEAQKRQADLNAKLQEIKEYDEKIAHIANQRVSIDLDNGVKVNYEKFKDILAKIK